MRHSQMSRLPVLVAVAAWCLIACADGVRLLPQQRVVRLRADSTTVPAPPAPQSITTEELLALHSALLAEDFPQLDARMTWHQDSARLDNSYEIRYAAAFNVFSTPDPALHPHLDAWVAAEPKSGLARLARGAHSVAMGIEARGTQYATETPAKKMEAMGAWFRIAYQDLQQASEGNAGNVMTRYVFLELGRYTARNEVLRKMLSEGLGENPGSLILREEYAFSLRPRWGGSAEEMDAFADESDSAAKLNPRVRLLHGFVAYDSAVTLKSAKQYDAAIEMFSNALAFGDYWLYRMGRADAYRRAQRYDEAIADYDTALIQLPALTEARAGRAALTARLVRRRRGAEGEEMLRRAKLDMCIAAELDSTNYDLKWEVEHEPELLPASMGGAQPLSPMTTETRPTNCPAA